jgi:pyruvate carboxylase
MYDVPDSVVGFMAGEHGDLPGGWPEPFRTKILTGKNPQIGVATLTTEQQSLLSEPGRPRQELLNTLLFPGPTKDFEHVRETYGDVSVIKTKDFLYGLALGEETVIEVQTGVSLYVSIDTISEPDERGVRNVQAGLNGQLRPVGVRDKSISVVLTQAEKADPTNPKHVAAPFSGVVTLSVAVGDQVKPGAPVATIEAMKMEAAISAPVAGVVQRLAIPHTQQVEAGDLIVVLE